MASLLLACAEVAPSVYPIEDATQLEVLFGVELDRSGRVLSTPPPFFLDGEARAQVQRFVAPVEHETWLIGYGAEELRQFTELYDPSRRASLELQIASPAECAKGRLLSAEGRFVGTAPPPRMAWRTTGEGLEPAAPDSISFIEQGQVSLSVPIDERACIEPSHRALTPYADRDVPIPLGTMLGEQQLSALGSLYLRVFRLPDDRILLITPAWMFLLDRGQAFISQTGRFLFLGGGNIALASDAYGTRNADDPIHIVIVHFADDSVGPGVWHNIELDDSGLVLRESFELAEAVQDVLFDPAKGWFIGAGARGSIVVQRSRGAELEWLPDRFVNVDLRALITRTGWSDRPYAVTGGQRGQISIGTPDLEEWTLLPTTGLDPAARFRAVTSAPRPEGTRLYVAHSDGLLHWFDRAKSRWTPEPLVLPSAYECGGPTLCGGSQQVTGLRDLSYVERAGIGHLYATMNDCMAILDIRLDRPCPDYLPMPGRADLRPSMVTTPLGEVLLNVRAIDISPSGWLTVASQEGGVYELYTGPSLPEGE